MKIYEDSWGDLWLRLGDEEMLLIKVRDNPVANDLFIASTSYVQSAYGPLMEMER